MDSKQFFSGKRSHFSKESNSDSRNKKRKQLEDDFGDEGEEEDVEPLTEVPLEEGEEEINDREESNFEPFNLKEERRNGRFDEKSGGYQQTRGEREENEIDAWVLEYESKEKEGKTNPKSEFIVPQRKFNFFEETESKDPIQLQKQLITLLQEGESPRIVLNRLSTQQKEFRRTKEKEKLNESKKMFDEITELTSDLQTSGFYDILDETVETIRSRVSAGVNQEKNGKKIMWEYKDSEGKLQGPFSNEEMLEWTRQGYFQGESSVMIRRVLDDDEDDIFAETVRDPNPFVRSDSVDFSSTK